MNKEEINESWTGEEFSRIFFERTGRFSSDETALKEEFKEWFIEESQLLFDFEHKHLKTNNLKRTVNFLNLHPLSSGYNKKDIALCKSNCSRKFDMFMAKFFLGMGIVVSFLKPKGTSVASLIKKNPVMFYTCFTALFVGNTVLFRHKIVRTSFEKQLNEKGYFKAYFEEFDLDKL